MNLAVPNTVTLALEKAGLTTLEAVLEYSQGDLIRRTGLNASQVYGLVEIASETLLGNTLFSTALDIYQKEFPLNNWGRLSTGCPVLDECLEGGILPAALTEISGTSGAGKTQLTLQLSLMAQLSPHHGGLGGGAILILTEGPLPSGRLKQMSSSIAKRFKELDTVSLMNNVLVHHCEDTPSLISLLKHRLPMLLNQYSGIKVVLIDSIAALFRSMYEPSESALRSQDLKTIASLLKDLTRLYEVTVVCTNQMTADLCNGIVKPALGLLWSTSLNARLVLVRNETVDNEEEFQEHVKIVPRTMRVEFSPHLPPREVQYFIDNEGVFGLT